MSFLSSPTLADVDGDGKADILMGSGGYMVRAFRADGAQPLGWPKFTFGWIMGSPTAGDVDGDGKVEVVVATREGQLYVWDTPGTRQGNEPPLAGYGAGPAQYPEPEFRRFITCRAPDPLGRFRVAGRVVSNLRRRKQAASCGAQGLPYSNGAVARDGLKERKRRPRRRR